MEYFGILLASLLLGLRHGFDLDHIAALTDITTGSTGSRKDRVKLSLWYASGHEAVVCLLGFSIILFAWSVPAWADHLMGKAIGITLILMAIITVMSRRSSHVAHASRGIAILHRFVIRKPGQPFVFNRRNVFAIGLIHGIGAETPTQLLLFTSVAGLTAKEHGLAIVAIFSAGLLITHLLLAIAGVWMQDLMKRMRSIVPMTVYAASCFSFLLGFSYLIKA